MVKIWKRQRYRLDLGFSLTPNSNLNGGPDLATIDLFGLPFELSDDAQQASGVGVTGFIAATHFQPVGGSMRLRSVASLWMADYSGQQYDDTLLTLSSGPSRTFGQEAIWLAASVSRRWFAGEAIQKSGGLKVSVDREISSGSGISLDFEFRAIDFEQRSFDDGNHFSLVAGLHRIVNSTSQATFIVRLSRYYAAQTPWSYSQAGLGARYRREMTKGISVEIRPEISWRSYDELQGIFGKQRRDVVFTLSGDLAKRDWRLYGFSPKVGYQYTEGLSSLELYRYSRHQVNFGMTRSF